MSGLRGLDDWINRCECGSTNCGGACRSEAFERYVRFWCPDAAEQEAGIKPLDGDCYDDAQAANQEEE